MLYTIETRNKANGLWVVTEQGEAKSRRAFLKEEIKERVRGTLLRNSRTQWRCRVSE